LFKGWMRLSDWSKESLEDLRLEQAFKTVTHEWLQSGREASYLASGTRLALLEEWVQKKIIPLTPHEQDFFDASLAERDERAQRELQQAQEATALAQQVATEAQKAAGEAQKATKAQRAATVRLGIVVVLLIAMVIGALVLTAIAQRSAAEAESLAQVFKAQVEFNHDNNQVALRLALDAAQVENPPAIVQSMLIDAAYAPGTVRLYDAFDHELDALALSHDGHFALIGEGGSSSESATFAVQLWDLNSEQLVRTLLENTASTTAVAFNPDASIAYSADYEGIVRALDVQTGEELWHLEGLEPIRAIQVSHDGHYMLLGGGTYDAEAAPETYAIWLVDALTGAKVCELVGHTSPVYSLAFSPDDTMALSGSGTFLTSQGDNSLRSWNLATCEPILPMDGHEDIVQDIAFSPDGLTAVTASADHTLIRWNLDTGEILRRYGADGEDGHTDWVNRVVTHPNGRWMLSGGWDNQLILWDLWTGHVLHRFIGHQGPVNGVALAPPDGRFAFSVSDDKTIRVWEITNALLEHHFAVDAAPAMLRVRISPDQQYVVSGSTDGVLRLWDVATGQLIWDVPAHLDNRIYALAFSPDNRYIVSGGADQKLYLWDVRNGDLIREFLGHAGRIWMVDYSPDNRYIVSGSDDDTVRIWDAATGEQVLSFPEMGQIYAVDFSPDSRYVLAGGVDTQLYLFDIEQQTLVHTFEGHIASMNAIDFSPDGQFAVSGGYDNHLIVWDLVSRQRLVQLEGHFAPIMGVEFSADGSKVVSGSVDGTVRLWNWREGTEQGRISYGTQILSVGIAAEAQRIAIGSQGSVDLLRLPELNMDDLTVWIYANRYLGE
jgi:WD40 repeat protein